MKTNAWLFGFRLADDLDIVNGMKAKYAINVIVCHKLILARMSLPVEHQ